MFELVTRPDGAKASTLPPVPLHRLRAAGLATIVGERQQRPRLVATLSDEGRFALCLH